MQSIYLIWYKDMKGKQNLVHILTDGIEAAQYCNSKPNYSWEEWIKNEEGNRFRPQLTPTPHWIDDNGTCTCSSCRPDLYKETVKVYPAPGLYKTGEAIKLERRDNIMETINKVDRGTAESLYKDGLANHMEPVSSPATSCKLSITALPQIGVVLGAEAMRDGDSKHGPYNWHYAPISARLLIDGTLRHLFAWMRGEEKASDSGVHHLGHCIARLSILLDAQANGTLIDDRPVKKVK